MLLYQIFVGIHYFFEVIRYMLLIYWVLSLFRPNFKLYYMLESFLAPIMRPFRYLNMKLMSKMRGGVMIDFSIWFTLIGLSIAQQLCWQVYAFLA